MISRLILCMLAAAVLSGCAELVLKPYGNAAQDAENARVGMVLLPEGAPTISQGYNPDPETDSEAASGAGHEGIDIYAKTGTPVIAPAAGIVIKSSSEPFYGNQIIIDHKRDEDGNFIRSRLLHLDTRLVEEGEIVVRGQKIGTLGSTGLLASYPHLHFETRIKKDSGPRSSLPVNPHKYWINGTGDVTCFDKSKDYPDHPFRITYPVPCK